MSYAVIDSFSLGLDRRRPRHAANQGSVWDAINVHITRGGDIEKRKAFVPSFNLPTGTSKGVSAASGSLYSFGSGPQPDNWPAGIIYQQVAHQLGYPLTEILDTTVFDGKPYVVAKFSNGDVQHFYNGTVVADFVPGSTTVPTNVFTYRTKVYGVAGSLLKFSAINQPTLWASGTGSGYLNIANHDTGGDNLYGIEVFQGNLVALSRRNVQIWTVKEDPAGNTQLQTLRNTGTRIGRSALAYGDLDVFYLDETGVRSVRARNTSNTGSVNDIGTPIDTYIQAHLRTLAQAVLERGVSCIEPTDSRYWLSVGNKIFVFSYFPSSKVSAWTVYETPFVIEDFAVINEKVYARSGDTIYLYGGDNGNVYDDTLAIVKLPFMSFRKPGTDKQLRGVDISAEGKWDVCVLVNPNVPSQKVNFGTLEGITFLDMLSVGCANTPFLAPEFSSSYVGPATISGVALYTEGGGEE